jgi:hypothetical protein
VRINYGPWAPDSAGVDVPVLEEARNVFPYQAGYGPIPSLQSIDTSALPSQCLGAAYAKTSTGDWVAFAGTATKLYRLVDTTWTDYSRVAGGNYNATEDDLWSFTQFGSRLIAGQVNDATQYIDVDSGATNFAALPNAPQARYWTTVGDFVVAASISGGDTRKVKNSAINDSEGWTVGTDLCDEQSFPDGGRVTGAAGGEFGYIVQERAIRRMIFQPGQDYAFRYELVDRERGCSAGYSLSSVAGSIYFLSDDGFYSYGPNGISPIGAETVNQWFSDNSDSSRFFNVLAFVDPFGPRVGWAFHNSTSDTNYTRVLFYNWKTNRWSYAIQEAQFWVNYATAGITLEGLDALYPDLDAMDISLDSRTLEGGRPGLAAINSAGELAFLDGTEALTALIRTAPIRLDPGWRSKNFEIEPLGVFNDATHTYRIGKRENTSQSITYTGSLTPSTATGIVRGRASGRVHTFEQTIAQSSGTRWTLAQGLEIRSTRDGRK